MERLELARMVWLWRNGRLSPGVIVEFIDDLTPYFLARWELCCNPLSHPSLATSQNWRRHTMTLAHVAAECEVAAEALQDYVNGFQHE